MSKQNTSTKHISTLVLKVIIILIGVGVFTALLMFPKTEGRAKDLDLISIYSDPFIIYGYIASSPFFIWLYQAFKLLNFIDKNEVFSKDAVRALKIMKFASISLIGSIILALIFIRFFGQGDDPAGPTMLGIIVSLIFAIITAVVAFFQKHLQNAIDILL